MKYKIHRSDNAGRMQPKTYILRLTPRNAVHKTVK